MEFFLVGSGLNVAGTLFGAGARSSALREQARVAEIQAEIALEQGRFAARMQRRAGRDQATYLRRQSLRRVSGMVVHTAEAGLEVSGSPAIAIAEQIHRDEQAAAQVITNSRMRAFSQEAGARSEAASHTARASALLDQAGITLLGGFLEAIGNGLAAAGTYQQITGGTAPSYVSESGFTGGGPYAGF